MFNRLVVRQAAKLVPNLVARLVARLATMWDMPRPWRCSKSGSPRRGSWPSRYVLYWFLSLSSKVSKGTGIWIENWSEFHVLVSIFWYPCRCTSQRLERLRARSSTSLWLPRLLLWPKKKPPSSVMKKASRLEQVRMKHPNYALFSPKMKPAFCHPYFQVLSL